jgi:DNA-binding NtrC family response regulator
MNSRMHIKVVPLNEVPAQDVRRSGEDSRPVILVVHDERVVADCMATVLSRAGFDTMVAYDGRRALELAFEVQPQLLVSDIGIREMDGIQLAMSVVNAMPECKVLLFSGHETSEILRGAYDQGYEFPWLAKPVHPAGVVKQVMACFADSGMASVQ